MELTDYLRILHKRWWILLLVTLLTTAAAFGFSKLQTPVYKSTVQLSVLPARNDNGAQLTVKALLRSYAKYVHSTQFAQRVINTLQLDMLPETLRDQIKIESIDEDFIIQIDVENTDGNIGNDIANEWANQFVIWRNQQNTLQRKEDRVIALIREYAGSFSQARPRTSLNTIAGAVIGLTLGGLIIFVLEWIESGVLRTSQDVERATEMSVLGAIPPS